MLCVCVGGGGGGSGGAKVLGKLPVLGRPTNLDYSRARACCACSRCGCLSFIPLSPCLWETARYRLKYCLKGPLSPKQPTNQPMLCGELMFAESGNRYRYFTKFEHKPYSTWDFPCSTTEGQPRCAV